MQSGAVVATDVVGYDPAQIVVVVERGGVDDVGLHRGEEGFDEGVVAELARALHRLQDPVSGQASAVAVSAAFDAAVGVEDQPRRWRATPHGLIECGDRHDEITLVFELPTHDAPGMTVHDHSQIAPGTAELEIGDVPYPDLVDSRGLKADGEVGQAVLELPVPRAAAVDAIGPRSQPSAVHQADDPLATDADAGGPKRPVDPRAPVARIA